MVKIVHFSDDVQVLHIDSCNSFLRKKASYQPEDYRRFKHEYNVERNNGITKHGGSKLIGRTKHNRLNRSLRVSVIIDQNKDAMNSSELDLFGYCTAGRTQKSDQSKVLQDLKGSCGQIRQPMIHLPIKRRVNIVAQVA